MTDDAQPRYFYFDVTYAVSTHDWIIEKSGGLTGTKDIGQLESPLEHIQNDWYYPEIEDKLTHLVFSINKNHAFNDGNKRSSLALGAYFLELNGFDYIVQHFVREMENIALFGSPITLLIKIYCIKSLALFCMKMSTPYR